MRDAIEASSTSSSSAAPSASASALSPAVSRGGQYNVLKTLIRLHASRFPWGSLSNHYSPSPLNSLSPNDVFDKFVTRGLGGHCLEFVVLFGGVLRALGYDFYVTGARIGPAMGGGEIGDQGFHGWSHAVLIVTMDGVKYAVDAQYLYITEPVPLIVGGEDFVFESIPRSVVRLRYTSLAEVVPNRASNSGLMTWLFEYKYSADDEGEWMSQYIFSTETEWFLEDFEIMNVWLANARDSYLLTQFVMKRSLLEGELDASPDDAGVVSRDTGSTLDTADGLVVVKPPALAGIVQIVEDTFSIWADGKLHTNIVLKTEKERLEIMKKWFRVVLTKDEEAAVMGRPVALRLHNDNQV